MTRAWGQFLMSFQACKWELNFRPSQFRYWIKSKGCETAWRMILVMSSITLRQIKNDGDLKKTKENLKIFQMITWIGLVHYVLSYKCRYNWIKVPTISGSTMLFFLFIAANGPSSPTGQVPLTRNRTLQKGKMHSGKSNSLSLTDEFINSAIFNHLEY